MASWCAGTVTHAVSARRTSDQAVRPAARSGPREGRASRETYGEPRAAAAAPASRTWSPSRTPTLRSDEPGGENTPYGRLCGPKGSPSGTSKGGIGCCLAFGCAGALVLHVFVVVPHVTGAAVVLGRGGRTGPGCR